MVKKGSRQREKSVTNEIGDHWINGPFKFLDEQVIQQS